MNYPLQVDCAFYRGALAEQDEDPTLELEAEVEAQKATMCDGCNANLKDLYCAQTVPPCGSFQDHIELAIVPPLQRIVQGQIDGDNIADAVAKEVPNLVKTLALVAPCRRYCEAITSSCGCGRKITIGQVLASNKTKNILPAPPEGISYEQLLAQVKDTPLCDLYANETELGSRDTARRTQTPDRRHVRLVLGQQRDPNLRGGTPRRRTPLTASGGG